MQWQHVVLCKSYATENAPDYRCRVLRSIRPILSSARHTQYMLPQHRVNIRKLILTYYAPVWSNTSSYNYRRLQISQSKFLRVTGNFPRRTPIPRLYTTLNITPIRDFIYHLTANFFDRCAAHPNPFARSIANYSLADLHHQYKKYIHKRPKHILF